MCGIVIHHSPKASACDVLLSLKALRFPNTEKRNDPRKKTAGAPIVTPKLF
jgi:hypothetical protein